MSEIGTWAEAKEFERERAASMTPLQRLQWLRGMQEFAIKAGVFERAVATKSREQETQWKSAKQ